MTRDIRTPSKVVASGTWTRLPITSVGTSASAAPPSHSSVSSQALRRRQEAARPHTASTLRARPNVATDSVAMRYWQIVAVAGQ
jgi:hypothetical protein